MRTPRTVLAAVAVAGLALTSLPALAQGEPPPTVSVGGLLPAAPDYASEIFGDPWDYSNAEDILTDDAAGAPMSNTRNARLEDGRLKFDATLDSWFSPVWVNYTTALPTNRDGPLFPVHADRYTHLSMSMYASRDTSAAIMWFRCREFRNECLGGQRLVIREGWNTYDLELGNEFPGLTQPWAGTVLGLRVALAPSEATSFEVDWLRLYRRVNQPVPVSGGGPLYWDADTDPGNNLPSNPGWGYLPGVFHPDGFPPGAYRFYVDHGTGPGQYSQPIVVDTPPLPAILEPDMAGGEDYATALTGDPWDFSQQSDGALHNVADVVWADGVVHATNGPPTPNDPYVQLRLHPSGINPDRYHRLTFTMTYDGEFDLADAPGGGAHGRVIWQRADTGEATHDGRALVTFTDRRTYTAVLATQPPTEVQEPENAIVRGWTGAPVTSLRFDPNEDRGARRWHLDDIRLAADDTTGDGYFTIRWRDANHQDGTVVSVRADLDRTGFDGAVIGDAIVQQPGENAFTWDAASAMPGHRWIHVSSDDGTSHAETYATGPLYVDARLAGIDRLDTALSLSRNAFRDGAEVAVVASAGDFPDALAAAPLAAAAGGPVLLNVADRLDPRVRGELERLGVETIYLLGGAVAQSEQVERELASLGVEVRRLAGADRYGTAAAAAREAVNRWRDAGDLDAGSEVLVALGTSYPDALSAGPLAAAAHRPLLLVAPDLVPPSTVSALRDLGATRATVIGGPAAVPDATAGALGVPWDRIGGRSRYDTAVLVAGAASQAGARLDTLLLATGEGFADALAAGPVVAARGGVLLLTGRATVPPETEGFLRQRAGQLSWLRVAGGPAAVTDATVNAILGLAGVR